MTLTDKELLDDLQEFVEETGETSSVKYNEMWDGHSANTFYRHFKSWPEALEKIGISTDSVKCPHEECGIRFHTIGNHWNNNPSHRPNVSDRQDDIITGLIMGDGTAVEGKRNHYIQCAMTNKEFLEWIDEEMEILGTGVIDGISAEDQAKKHRETGFNPSAKTDNLSDQYVWWTKTHPEFNRYRDWYNEEEGKQYPDDLELNDLILKVWYCCDGSKSTSKGGSARVNISCSNEYDSPEKIKSLFDDFDVEVKINRAVRKDGKKDLDISFDSEDSKKLWEYMGDPLPGFEYKWPTEEELEPNNYWWTEEEKEILREKYPEQGGYIEELDYSRQKIVSRAHGLGIKHDPERKYKDKEWLEKKYWEEGLTIQEIADIFDMNYTSIWEWFDKLGIERRKPPNKR